MKVVLARKTNIISFPNEFCLLEKIDTKGYYCYSISYQINPTEAMKSNAYLVKIYVSKESFANKTTNIFNQKSDSDQQVVENILTNNSANRDLTRNISKDNILVELNSDFTKKIPNNVASSLKNSQFSKKKKEIKLELLETLKSKNINPTIFDINLIPESKTNIDTSKQAIDVQQTSMDLLINQSIDPALYSSKNRLIVPTIKAKDGTISKTNDIKTMAGTVLVDSLSSYSQNSSIIAETLSNSDTIPIEVLVDDNFITVTEQVLIPISLGNLPELYLVAELIDQNSVPVQTESRVIQHSKNIINLQIPKLPPIVSAINHFGRTILEFKQVDENAVSINIYRKILPLTTQNNDSTYTFVSNVKCTKQDETKRYEDKISNLNPVIYRLIPIDTNGNMGSEFTSIISKAKTGNINVQELMAKRTNNFAVLTYRMETDGITVEVKDIPSGVISVELYRQDQFSRMPIMIAPPIQITSKGNTTVFFKDTKVSLGRIYQYIGKILFRNGTSLAISNKLIVEYNPERTNIVNTTLVNPKVVQTPIGPDVQFSFNSNFAAKDEDDIQKALNVQGLNQYFLNDIRKDKLQELIAYHVTRVNMSSGQIEEFGTITDSDFSDTKFGPVKGVAPLQAGNDYKYIVNTHLRSADTLLQNFVKEVTGSINFAGIVPLQTGSNYKFQPYKWRHPIALEKGNIISENTLKTNHAKTQFTFGKIGNITSTTLSLSTPIPTIFDALATKLNSTLTRVQWKIQGEANKIDHFIVMIDILGKRTIAGKCHNITNTNQFQFYDVLDDGEMGSLTYYIVPVYYDYSRGKEVNTNKVYI